MKCINISRNMAEDGEYLFSTHINVVDNWAFICINNPGQNPTNLPKQCDLFPRLDLFFFDLTEPRGRHQRIPEPTDAAEIVDFILKNKDKNFCIHCTAGISRSGAVSAFLVNNLGYECPTWGSIYPNPLLSELLNKMYRIRIGTEVSQ